MRKLLLSTVVVLSCSAAQAATVTFTFTGTSGGGAIGPKTFGEADFILTGIGDTEDRISFDGGYTIPHYEASIYLDGVGVYHFKHPTRTFVNNDLGLIGFSVGGADFFHGPISSEFIDYDFMKSINTVSGNGQVLQWLTYTTVGKFTMKDYTTTGSFSSHVAPIPLPASIWFMVLGFLPFVRKFVHL